MSISFDCKHCGALNEVPDALAGQETVCPRCEATIDVPLEDEVQSARAQLDAFREQSRFLRDLDSELGKPPRPVPPAPEPHPAFTPAIDRLDTRARLAGEAALRLRDVALYLLGLAYLTLGLSLLGAGAVTVLVPDTTSKVVGILGALLTGGLLYCILKALSESVRALSDVAELARAIGEHLFEPPAQSPRPSASAPSTPASPSARKPNAAPHCGPG